MKIAVGMSGGVDSAVTAALLKEEGHEVIGIHLRLYKDQGEQAKNWLDRSCCKIGLAKHVVNRLGIPLEIFDVQEAFQSSVIANFAEEYEKGRTPNPCIICNEKIKFGTLIEKGFSLGADAVATGHYAKIVFEEKTQSYQLFKPKDTAKDQTYFLYRLGQRQLPHILFPLSEFEKEAIYRIAEELDFPYEDVLESQEVCFVNQGDYRLFLKETKKSSAAKGEFVSMTGNHIGNHEGVPYYTVGQRRGLGVATGKRQYVIQINPADNRIILGDENDLLKREAILSDLSWVSGSPPDPSLDYAIKIRYRAREVQGRILLERDSRIRIIFHQPQKGISPGQSAVLYLGDKVLGGGIIQ
jgi:tRNA-specific 2-thiouridylase